MPLVRVSVKQLDVAQELYVAATKFITSVQEKGEHLIPTQLDALIRVVNQCKEEYEKHG